MSGRCGCGAWRNRKRKTHRRALTEKVLDRLYPEGWHMDSDVTSLLSMALGAPAELKITSVRGFNFKLVRLSVHTRSGTVCLTENTDVFPSDKLITQLQLIR